MLYLLGGASRAGKSTLARRLLARQAIPYFSLDVLAMGLVHGWPEFGLDPDDTAEVRGERLWPIIKAMAVNLLEEAAIHPTYLIEGDVLLPLYVSELMHAYPGQVRACFLGYTEATPEAKAREIRAGEAGWLTGYSEGEVLAFMADTVRFSRYLRTQCRAAGLPYVDCSSGLDAALDDAYAALVGK